MANWDDVQFAGSARATGNTPAALAEVNGSGIYQYRFTNGKELHFRGQLPHTYHQYSPLLPHVHWMAESSATYAGTWTLEYLWTQAGPGIPLSTKQTLTGTFNGAVTAWESQVTNLGAMAHDFKISALILCRLVLTLTSGSGVFLLDFDAHHENDALGSVLEFIK